ncbi:hypothetical protein BDR04DRAFT_1035882 [Suillus decipiens]|nr:hypothetical protein BDR04DRAFT_1035882 [Suillus decipiens]
MYIRLFAGGRGYSQNVFFFEKKPNFNGENLFIREFAPTDEFVCVADCSCPTCCQATTSGAFCT